MSRSSPPVLRQLKLLFLGLVLGAGGSYAKAWFGSAAFSGSAMAAESVRLPSPHVVRASDLVPVVSDSDADPGLTRRVPIVDVSLAAVSSLPAVASLKDTENYLLVGLDTKPWQKHLGLADTLVLAALHRETGHLGMVSIPRDYYVAFGAADLGRINEAPLAAARYGEKRAPFMKRVVGQLLGIEIRNIAFVDLFVLEKVVDAVGGIEVQVPCSLIDNFIDPREPSGRRVLSVESGVGLFDGPSAAMYARSRHGRTDWDRARRQQAIVLGLRKRLSEPSSWVMLPELLGALGEHIESDLSRADLISRLRAFASLDGRKLHGMVIPSDRSEAYRTPDGKEVLLPKIDGVRESLEGLFAAPSPGSLARDTPCPDADVAVRRNHR